MFGCLPAEQKFHYFKFQNYILFAVVVIEDHRSPKCSRFYSQRRQRRVYAEFLLDVEPKVSCGRSLLLLWVQGPKQIIRPAEPCLFRGDSGCMAAPFGSEFVPGSVIYCLTPTSVIGAIQMP